MQQLRMEVMAGQGEPALRMPAENRESWFGADAVSSVDAPFSSNHALFRF